MGGGSRIKEKILPRTSLKNIYNYVFIQVTQSMIDIWNVLLHRVHVAIFLDVVYFEMTRKQPPLVIDGYDFKFDKCTDSATIWSCPFLSKTSCKCRLWTSSNIVHFMNTHNHPPKGLSLANMSLKQGTVVSLETTSDQLEKRKNCRYCPSKISRKTAYKCVKCQTPTCQEHSKKICNVCLTN